MTEECLEIKLLKGSTVIIDGIKIQPLTLEEIVEDIDLDEYYKLLGILAIDKIRLKDMPKEVLNEFETFDIFLSDQSLMTSLLAFFKTFLKHDDVFFMPESQNIEIRYEDNLARITRYNYDKITRILRKMYCVQFQKEDEYNPHNDKARELIEKIKKKNAELARLKSKQGEDVNIISIISGVAWKSTNTNIFDVFNLTVFQLYDAFYRLEIVDNYNNTMTGLYAGTVDAKKTNMKQLTWAKRYSSLIE